MATYYASSSASGGGAGTTGDPYTLQELLDNTDAGDLGLVMADGTYTPSATIDVDNANAQTILNPAIIRGAASNGDDDGTVATISGSSLGASTNLITIAQSTSLNFENIRFTAATNHNVYSASYAYMVFKNCTFDNASSYGFYTQSSSSSHVFTFINCEFYDNDYGVGTAVVSRGGFRLYGCLIHDNTNDGFADGGRYGKTHIEKSIIYDNGGDGAVFLSTSQGAVITDTIFFGNGGDGIDTDNGHYAIVVLGCIFRSNGGYGINTNTGTNRMFHYCDYNCYSNNTSGAIDINSGTPPGSNNVTSDPSFTSETDGSEDFTLQSGSPCINAGLDPEGY